MRSLSCTPTISFVPMNRRKRPILRPFDEPVLDRIHPTIPDMRCKILIIADMMFPIPPLPNRDFALVAA